MDALKAQWERILQQLGALTATQKMLVGALVAVMVMTVLYWGRYASNPEMVSLLGDQVLTADDIGPIQSQLELSGVTSSVVGSKIMVPTDRKNEIMANLMFARVLPQDTHSAFETMSKQLNPFTSNTERDATYNEATAMELSSIIGQFPGVSSAKVIINAKNEQRIEGGIPPTATVFITTRGTPEHSKALVRAAADGVAHAVSGLRPGQISVIVNGDSKKVPDSDDGQSGGDDLVDIKQHIESSLEQKIREHLSFIPGLTVTVTCDIENRTIETKGLDYDKGKAAVLPNKTITNTEETSTSAAVSHEPGVSGNAGANGSASVDGGSAVAAAPNTTSTEHTEQDNGLFVPQLETITKTPAGKDTVQSATVRVPMSFFDLVYRKKHPSGKAPDDSDIADVRKLELAKIRQEIKTMLVLKSDDSLSVEDYPDITPELAMAAGPAAQSLALTTVSGHAKEIGVAVLAVVSLMMMAMMVRKSAPAPVVLGGIGQSGGSDGEASSPAARSALNSLIGAEMVAGEVGGGNGALDGMEMDEDAVRTQQMLDQVSTMVKENPDGAAALVKRWLSRP